VVISSEQLAEVIRDNIAPGDGPIGDLYLDCAAAVMAAVSVPLMKEGARQYAREIEALRQGKDALFGDILTPCETRAVFEARSRL